MKEALFSKLISEKRAVFLCPPTGNSGMYYNLIAKKYAKSSQEQGNIYKKLDLFYRMCRFPSFFTQAERIPS